MATPVVQKYNSRFLAVDGGDPVYSGACPEAAVAVGNRYEAIYLGNDGGSPIYGFARCHEVVAGRFLMRYIGNDGGTPIYSVNCCRVCELVPSDLPTVAISGMTGGPWYQVGVCCYRKSFSMASVDQYECSGALWTNDMSFECVSEAMYSPVPEWEEAWPFAILPHPTTGVPCYTSAYPSTSEECSPDWFSCGTTTAITTDHIERRLLLKKTFLGISVYVAKVTLTCPYEAPVEKYMIASTYSIAIGAKNKTFSTRHITVSATSTQDCCVVADPIDTTTGDPYSCDAAGWGSGGSQATYTYTRFKFYDTMPTGTILFTDADVYPEGCTFDVCELDHTALTEICFTGAANPRPVECMTPTLGSTDLVGQCFPSHVRRIGPLAKDPGDPCDGFYNAYASALPGNSLCVTWCVPTITDDKTFTLGTVDDPPCGAECYRNVAWQTASYSTDEGDCGCNAIPELCDCYFSYDDINCVECYDFGTDTTVTSFMNCIIPKSEFMGDNVISISFSQTLSSVTPQEICIPAPTWSIELS